MQSITKWLITLSFILVVSFFLACAKEDTNDDDKIGEYANPFKNLLWLISTENNSGIIKGGSEAEKALSLWLVNQISKMGQQVRLHEFEYTSEQNIKQESQNVIVDINPGGERLLIVGAHMDNEGKIGASNGTLDNHSSVAVLLSLAEYYSQSKHDLNVHLRLIFFGAEENGLNGSFAYARDKQDLVEHLESQVNFEGKPVIGMLNLDTIAGGDYLYIHSAASQAYDCKDLKSYHYSANTDFANALRNTAHRALGKENIFKKHPGSSLYPKGETGGWSDHRAFACLGIPVAYIEATNFEIRGRNGKDGYSQTTHPAFWDCFDKATLTACDDNTETKWGMLWHTPFDRLDVLDQHVPNRINEQMTLTKELFIHFLKEID